MTADTVDFPAVAWQELERAAAESTWLPLGYQREKWTLDACNWLRHGARGVAPSEQALIETLRQTTHLASSYLRLTGGGLSSGSDQEVVRRAANLIHAAMPTTKDAG